MESGKIVGIWIRVSTEDQVKGESPEHHEKRARYYAESKSWNVKEVYLLEAVSGKSVMEHSETKRMLSDIKSGKISGIIFSKLARLARNTKELLEFAEIFRKYNADLISLQESIDTSTPAGRLFYTMIAAMAQWEREEIAERVAASVPVRAKMGKPLGGQAPFGYRWVDKKLVIDPTEAPIRKLIHELFVQHKRKKTVATILNQSGHLTRNGSKFTNTTILRLLHDPCVKGVRRVNYTKSLGDKKKWELKPESEWVLTEVEPIISEELWDKCQLILSEQASKNHIPLKKSPNLFSGIVECDCGAKMYVPTRQHKYVCTNCKNKILAGDLEEIYLGELNNINHSPEHLLEAIKKANSEIAEKEQLLSLFQSERTKLKKEMDELVKLYLQKEIPNEGFGNHYNPLFDRSKELDEKIPILQAEIDFLLINNLNKDEILNEIQHYCDQWKSLDFATKRTIVETITNKIIIGKEEISIHFHYVSDDRKFIQNGIQNHRGSLQQQA